MLTSEEFLPTQRCKSRCLWLILGLFFIYILENSPVIRMVDFSIFTYIIKPFLWIGLAFLVWTFPSIRPMGKLKHRRLVNLWSFNFAVIYIIVIVMVGLFIDGLGKSPYSHTLLGMITNIYSVGIALIGRELVRSYLVNSLTDKENYLVFILVSIVMTIFSISINKIFAINGLENSVQFLAQEVAPGFSENLLATYLVFLGGPLSSIIYLGIIESFEWLSPILPDLKWITKALIGVLLPTFYLMSIQSIYLQASKAVRIREGDKESPFSWIITSIISISIVWFAVGVFPIYPSVIATGSMEPMMKPGDVILVQKIVDMERINNLKVGDVVQFRRSSILISHRITEVKEDEEGIRYCTKGDNNSAPDTDLVKPEDIKGTIVYVVPKVGWPTLLMKSDKDVPLDEIVF